MSVVVLSATANCFRISIFCLLSDTPKLFVNLVAAVIALVMLIIAGKPADEKHAFNDGKFKPSTFTC